MSFRTVPFLILLPGFAVLALGGCSWYGAKPEVAVAEVQVRTNPAGADCELIGANEYRADVETPARLKIRTDASPLKVTCTMDGYRPAHGTLAISSKGWLSQTSDAIADIGADSLAVIGIDNSDDSPKRDPVTTFDATLKPLVKSYIKQ
jgi:hypothetical protein